MVVGHAAFALLGKRARPHVSLLLLVVAAYIPDILKGCFYAVHMRNQELSHSLVTMGFGATLVAVLYLIMRRNLADAAVIWLVYMSHWPADFITGIKPTWPGGPDVGLGLYEHPLWEALLEAVVLGVAWIIYSRRKADPSLRSG